MAIYKFLANFLICIASFAVLPTAYANTGVINLKMNTFKEQVVKTVDGKTKITLVPIDSAAPGDKVVYITEYSNINTKAVDAGALISNQVPANTQYVANSAYCDACTISYSIDGKRFDALSKLKVAQKDGTLRPAKESDIRHIRWRLSDTVMPQARGQVGFKIKIDENTL